MWTMASILEKAVANNASGLHLGAGICPSMRIDNSLVYMTDIPFTQDQIISLISEHLSKERFETFQEDKELDYSFGIPGLGRFRVNLFYQRSSIGCAIRTLPSNPMTFEEIGFPPDAAKTIVSKPNGLILVTGPTGSGKTTTLASMIEYINQHRACHIVTIEDPIEFLFKNKKSVVNQREVGSDTRSFHQALKHVLRQDPDVILIGEMRDLESIEIALLAAETGHLVFATLHTPSAVQSINRIIDVFPSYKQQQVRTQLSFVLQAVVSQELVARVNGGRILANEILLLTPAIRNLIRESRSHQIVTSMQMEQKLGMRTLNMSLAALVKDGKISKEEAVSKSSDVAELDRLLK
jgi:twitching motility protein PilT